MHFNFTDFDSNYCYIFSYLGDGRFHLESIMIGNPDISAYR